MDGTVDLVVNLTMDQYPQAKEPTTPQPIHLAGLATELEQTWIEAQMTAMKLQEIEREYQRLKVFATEASVAFQAAREKLLAAVSAMTTNEKTAPTAGPVNLDPGTMDSVNLKSQFGSGQNY